MRSSVPLAALTSMFFPLARVANGFVVRGGLNAATRVGVRSRYSPAISSHSRRRAMNKRLGETKMVSELDDDWRPEISTGLVDYVTPELGSSANKMLHVVYRVGNMDRTIKFYKEVFGMELLRYRDVPEGKYSNAFLGYGTESRGEHFSIELTYNYGVESYNLGDGFKCMGLRLPDLAGVVERAKAAGGQIVSGPQEVILGPSVIPDEPVGKETVIKVAVIQDPDGYKFEVIEEADRRDPVSKVSLLVLDMEKSIDFYQETLGMTLLRRRSLLPATTAQAAWMGYAEEDDSTMIELIYEYSREKIDRGDGYGQVAVSTPDVYKAAEAIGNTEYKVTRPPGPVPGIGTKITAVTDPDGFKTVIVDEDDIEKELEEAQS